MSIKVMLIVAALLAGGSGFSGYKLGKSVERGTHVNEMREQRDRLNQRLEAVQRESDEALLLNQLIYQESIEGFRAALVERERLTALARAQAESHQQSARRLRHEIRILEDRLSGDSICSIDPADGSLLNEAIQAANRSLNPVP